MYDREFFTSRLGFAALVSIAAMVAFNVAALTHQFDWQPQTRVVSAPMVELA
jgi:SNF family Na+-dependent transporter